jgi:hypothetical protein
VGEGAQGQTEGAGRTVDDPGAYLKTVQLKFTARRVRQDVELMEDICTENNQAGIAGGYKLNSEQR